MPSRENYVGGYVMADTEHEAISVALDCLASDIEDNTGDWESIEIDEVNEKVIYGDNEYYAFTAEPVEEEAD